MLPLVGRELPIIADDYVKTDFGTGALKITPGPRPQRLRDRPQPRPADELSVIGEDGRMTDRGRRAYAGLTVPRRARRVVAALRDAGADPRPRALHPHRPVQPALGRAHRAADLAAVVHGDGRAGRAGDRGRQGGPGQDPPGVAVAPLPRVAREHPPVVHLPPAVVGPPDPGLVPRRGDLRRHGGAPRATAGSATPTSSTPGSRAGALAVRDARAGPTRPPELARSTRPTCSPPRATSSSSGWRAW